MRWRLLVALLAFGAAAVAGFAWPLLISTSAQRTQTLVISRTADLDRFASLANQALSVGDTVALDAELRRYTDLYGESLLVVDTRRERLLGGSSLDVADPAVRAVIDGALRNQPTRPVPEVRPWSTSPVLLARPIGTGTRVAGAIVLQASVRDAALDVSGQWALILGGALLAALGCTGLAILVSRWVLRPVRDLESGVRATAAGSARTHVRLAGPPELRELESEFNRMSDAVADAAEQQRRLIADASHQLRNPMAALRLRIDTLGTTLPGDDTYLSTVAEVERLESLLDGMITLEKADSQPAEASSCDAILAIADRVDAWTPAADAAKVLLNGQSDEDSPISVACPTDEILEILDILLDNAIKYAGPGACVSVTATPGDPVLITVADTGPGLPAEELPLATNRFWRSTRHNSHRGNGLGLSIAHARITRRHGNLDLTPTHPTGLTAQIHLPAAREFDTQASEFDAQAPGEHPGSAP